MNAFMKAGFLKAEINRLMETYPELAEDETLRADMMEAETDLHTVIAKCLEQRQEAESMVGAIKERIVAMNERKARFQRKSDAMKDLMQSIMETADLPKVMLPEATLSILSGRVSVNVIDANELPQGYYAIERKPDKKAIKAAMEKGDQIPGAELVMGEDTLTIRSR